MEEGEVSSDQELVEAAGRVGLALEIEKEGDGNAKRDALGVEHVRLVDWEQEDDEDRVKPEKLQSLGESSTIHTVQV